MYAKPVRNYTHLQAHSPGHAIETETGRYQVLDNEDKRATALDIIAPKFTPIYAPCNGTIVRVVDSVDHKYWHITGYQVVIRDTDSCTHYLGHFQKPPKLKSGDAVNKGEIIGYVGNTGIKKMVDHVHYEIEDKNMKSLHTYKEVYK